MSTSTLKKQLQSDDNRCETSVDKLINKCDNRCATSVDKLINKCDNRCATSVDKLINKCKYHRNFQIYKYLFKFYKRKVGADEIK